MEKINGKIILVDEEASEKSFLEVNLKKLGWDATIEYFFKAEDALQYLKETKEEIFLVISEMTFSKMSGLELKKALNINPELAKKIVPFIFMSHSDNVEAVYHSYESIQGYFKKPYTMAAMAIMLDIIIKYWVLSMHPNKIEKIIENQHWAGQYRNII